MKICIPSSPKLVSAVENMFWVRRVIFISGGTGSDSFQINNYLNQNPGGGIANHHAFELVSKSQPLKLNNERALTPAVHWHIRLADTVHIMSKR